MRRVLIGHMDCAVGRRLVKALYHDPDVALVFGLGSGPTPSFLEPYQEKCFYQRLDLAKARHLTGFLGSERFARARFDSLILLPFGQENAAERIPGKVPALVSETRRLLEAARRDPRIERFVMLSSAFVYSPEPGNVNMMAEEEPLSFAADGDSRVRAWIDADLLCQNELKGPELCMTILRAPAIVTEAGELLHCPPLEYGTIPLGYDPMISVISDRDAARALMLALHSDQPGVYNVAGREIFPASELLRPARFGPLPLPRSLFGAVALVSQTLGRGRQQAHDYQRYGVVLDTSRAREALGFEPQYRVELRGRGGERQLDTVRYR